MAVYVSLIVVISLMYKVKRRGSKIESWGTLAVILLQVDLVLFMDT